MEEEDQSASKLEAQAETPSPAHAPAVEDVPMDGASPVKQESAAEEGPAPAEATAAAASAAPSQDRSSTKSEPAAAAALKRPRDEEVDDDTVPEETNYASRQTNESWSLGKFEAVTDRPMVEWEAGSNIWYQTLVLKQSLTEIQVHFPPTKLTSARSEWISRQSSRLWRGSLASSAWRYMKDREGAWEPRSSDTNSSGRGSQGPRASSSSQSGAEGRASGAARRPPSASGTRSRLSGRSRSRKRGGLSSSSRGSREEPAEDTAASPDVAAKDPRPGGEPDADWAPEGRGAPPAKLRRRTRFALDAEPEPHAHPGPRSDSESSARTAERREARRAAGPGARGRGAGRARSGDSSEGRAAPDAAVDGADPLLAWFREHARLLASRGLHALPAALPLLGDRRVEGAGAARATPASTRSPRGKRSRSDGGGEEWERSQSTASSGHARADSSRHSAHSGEDASPHGTGRGGSAAARLHRSDADSREPRTPAEGAGARARSGAKERTSPQGPSMQKPPLVVLEEVDIFSTATTPRQRPAAP